MEGWFNTHPEEDISDWFMVKKIVDHPGNKWGKNGNKCGGAPDQVGTWSGSHNRLKTNATSGEIDFKNISFREITPELLVTVSMPKKLMRCVRKVKSGGKSESAAFGICVKSTGQKPHKKKR